MARSWKQKGVCTHCGLLRWYAGRRLCRTCYNTPGLREVYVPVKDSGHVSEPPDPVSLPVPTLALPGSEEKIRVLQERLWSGCYLWHSDDLTAEPEYLRLSRGDLQPHRGHYKSEEADRVIGVINGLREMGFTRAEIACKLGMTRDQVSGYIYQCGGGVVQRRVYRTIGKDGKRLPHVLATMKASDI